MFLQLIGVVMFFITNPDYYDSDFSTKFLKTKNQNSFTNAAIFMDLLFRENVNILIYGL